MKSSNAWKKRFLPKFGEVKRLFKESIEHFKQELEKYNFDFSNTWLNMRIGGLHYDRFQDNISFKFSKKRKEVH
ncbi:hypothetical protein [Bacillus sp. B15-48]|uniref:hypothetical protein n=1 Tax=Bacillus sp. B15-48 TaxID=1548601 RepID=UPI00193FDA8E|nr:hypothetical protein [Bacillus sp. B15-48]